MPAAKLVPDPFNPGQRVPTSMAEIHPAERFAVAVERRFAAMAGQGSGPSPELTELRAEEARTRELVVEGSATTAALADVQSRLRAAETKESES